MLYKKILLLLVILTLVSQGTGLAQKPYRVGTTTANFLEIGIGSAGVSMGDAYTAWVNDLSAIYWNPAGLANIEQNEALFVYQPWVADINSIFAGFGLNIPTVGTIAIGIFGLDYGDIEVTNMEYQNGTGEMYSAHDYAMSFAYARSLVNWFSFGASAKYIQSKIWHSQASAIAFDLGVQVQTHLLSFTDRYEDGMRIGMSISNYGSRMQYDGDDLLFPVDIDESGVGNYQNTQGKYATREWELPLIFRVGISMNPVVNSHHVVTVSVDALHPNNMSEYLNMGMQYKLTSPGFGDFFLRTGYKALFADKSQYGATFGGGLKYWLAARNAVKVDYSFHSIGELGNVHCTTVGFTF